MKVKETYIVKYPNSGSIDNQAILFVGGMGHYVIQYESQDGHGTVLRDLPREEGDELIKGYDYGGV